MTACLILPPQLHLERGSASTPPAHQATQAIVDIQMKNEAAPNTTASLILPPHLHFERGSASTPPAHQATQAIVDIQMKNEAAPNTTASLILPPHLHLERGSASTPPAHQATQAIVDIQMKNEAAPNTTASLILPPHLHFERGSASTPPAHQATQAIRPRFPHLTPNAQWHLSVFMIFGSGIPAGEWHQGNGSSGGGCYIWSYWAEIILDADEQLSIGRELRECTLKQKGGWGVRWMLGEGEVGGTE
ncbi:hypothetical protein BDK51DRAFT_33783 [Blyttiomyces helicus]|uniref:Uncharacterized protein n=1 Tax=Blyttiomyces helicus TaxID=388810 RepID=A0A4P9WP18_9FUNG|nr:hypothetical protein BDK51DRAFT_33783 [Blyttiomyces helicus]|eukprot:RKO92526.1 hypothetical protein BDK51DRAFT_33783 [Blyttiomyces helicus]